LEGPFDGLRSSLKGFKDIRVEEEFEGVVKEVCFGLGEKEGQNQGLFFLL
jgi:hypothetical protein